VAAVVDIEPSLERARELSAQGNTIPLVHRFVDDCETPVSAFLKLRESALGAGPSFLLESAEQGRLGRYSFLGFRPLSMLRWSAGTASSWDASELDPSSPFASAQPSSSWEAADPYAQADEYVSSRRLASDGEMPPFPGGAVGFFGYDLVRSVEPLGEPNPDTIGLPDMALMIAQVMLVFDHQKHELSIYAYAFTDGAEEKPARLDAAYERAEALIEATREALRGPVPEVEPPGDPVAGAAKAEVRFESNMSREQFEANTAEIVEYIHAGDAFQVVPSQRFSSPTPVEAFSIYRGLRVVNPSPYMYYLDFGDFQLAGASPEPLIKVTGRTMETRPIAGTYPRGADEDEDRRNAEALLADPKERAEHLMLVDLGRNDLGRVCEYGSVTVDELMVVETYSHVLHIVSRVSGTLRPEVTAMEALKASLPAGTLSGAPKVRAMQIIDEVEPHKRGSYGGAIGYLGFNGDLDTAIHIRTVVVKDGLAHVQAGGGTVADAKPEFEFQESVNKAKAVFAAVELAASQPGWK
jgi:anthranilate synthase component 1